MKNTCSLDWNACGARLWKETIPLYKISTQLDKIPPENKFSRKNDIGKGGQVLELPLDSL